MTRRHTFRTQWVATAAAAMLLVACGKAEDRTVGQKVDSAIANVEQRTEAAKAEVTKEVAQAKASTQAAADKAARTIENVAGKMASKVEDAAVSASVNAELAKDPKLSALKIDVDTVNGRVQLKGSAPDQASRERATSLAAGVTGVISVDNRLEVR